MRLVVTYGVLSGSVIALFFLLPTIYVQYPVTKVPIHPIVLFACQYCYTSPVPLPERLHVIR